MSIAVVNTSSAVGAGAATNIASPATSLTAGNTIIVAIRRGSTTTAVNSVTDTAGNIYRNTHASLTTPSLSSLAIWYACNVTGNGSNVVTVNFGSVSNRSITTIQVSGLAQFPLDTWNLSPVITGTTPTSAALTTTVSNEIIMVFGDNDVSGSAWSASAGYTLAVQDSSNFVGCAYQIVNTIQTGITPSIVSADNTNHKLAIALTFYVPVTLPTFASGTIMVADADSAQGTLGVQLNSNTGTTLATHIPLGAIGGHGSGEGGAQLSDGTILVSSKGGIGSALTYIQIYDASLNELSTTTPFTSTTWSTFSPMASDFTSLFWVSKLFEGNISPSQVRSVTPAGTLGGTTYTLDISNLRCMGVTQDDQTLIYAGDADGDVIKTWNLVANSAGGTLVTAEPAVAWGQDLLVIPTTQSFVVLAQPLGGADPNYVLRRYSLAGALVSSFSLTGNIGDFSGARLSIDHGAPATSIWVRTYVDGTGDTTGFLQMSLVDGSTLAAFTLPMNNGGVGGGNSSNPPLCCPFFAWSNNGGGGGGHVVFVGTEETRELVRVRQVGLPALPGNVAQFIGRAEVQMQPGLGVPADPTNAPTIGMKWSGDNAVTFGTQKNLSLGKTGAYYTRAYVNSVGGGPNMRQPAVNIRCSDDVTFVPTDLFVTREEGTG